MRVESASGYYHGRYASVKKDPRFKKSGTHKPTPDPATVNTALWDPDASFGLQNTQRHTGREGVLFPFPTVDLYA